MGGKLESAGYPTADAMALEAHFNETNPFFRAPYAYFLALAFLALVIPSLPAQPKGADEPTPRQGWLTDLKEGKNQALKSGKPDQAATAFQRALEQYPSSHRAKIGLRAATPGASASR